MWIWVLMPGCAVVLIVMWVILGRDKKTIPVISTRPPEDLDPLEMEYAQIVTITDRGIFSMLLYWVAAGLLEIRERNTKEKDEKRVGVKRVAALPEEAPEHAAFLFRGLFRKSDTVWLDRLPEGVTEHKSELRDLVAGRFTGRNAVVQDDSMNATMAAMGLLIVAIFVIEVTLDVNAIAAVLLGILLFCALALLQNGALGFQSKHDNFEVVCGSIGTAVILLIHLFLLRGEGGLFLAVFTGCFLICIPCIMFMERRVNHRIYGQILGFRQYIETAEWDRLKQLSEENPNYGMDILPYAMLFGMGTKWTANFENSTICTCVEKMEEMTEEEPAQGAQGTKAVKNVKKLEESVNQRKSKG